jgi:subtilisin family serine protease
MKKYIVSVVLIAVLITLFTIKTALSQQQTSDATLHVMMAGGVWVDPTQFNVTVTEGCTLTLPLAIGNDLPEDLNFMIRTRVIEGSAQSIAKNNTVSSAQPPAGTAVSTAKSKNLNFLADNKPYKQGELIVRFAAKPNGRLHTLAEKNRILSALGAGSVKREFKLVSGLSTIKLPPGLTVEQALQKLNKAADILYAHPNYLVQAFSTIPNDTRFNELWGMHNTGQTGGTVGADIHAPQAWDIATGSRDIIVAVIDTGVDYTHPDLAANMWTNEAELHGSAGFDDDGNGYIDDIYGYDFVNNDGDPMDDFTDIYHGTHCSGTIGAIGNNAEGVAGVCWKVKIMAIKFLDSGGGGSTEDAISSVEYSVLMGANLSSNSWGGGGYSQGLKDAIDAAGAAGMLFVAAAGNSGSNNDQNPHYPSSYDSPSLIAVMATDKNDNKSSFSCYGPISVDLGAPGTDILSCKAGASYQYLSGTSMATPHVAGACALLWSMNPTMTNTEIKDILIQTVDKTLPGLCVSQGRLNLYNAILETRAPWLEIEPEEGTIPSGGSTIADVTFDATALTPATYQAEIVIISNDPCSPTVVPVTMTVKADDLAITPLTGLESSGTEGGPFTPGCATYTLTNNGIETLNWTAAENKDWLTVEPNAGQLEPAQTIDVNVCITTDADSLDPNIYTEMLIFQNINSGSTKQRNVTLTVKPPDCFTEFFSAGDNDLKNLMLTFMPDGSIAYYEACREKAAEFPTDPNGGTYIPLGDDDFTEIDLTGGKEFLFHGQWYDRFYVGSNGYITFGQGDDEFSASLENHFSMPRISGLFTDLTPADSHSISYKQLDDRVVVTFMNVPIYGDKTAANSFQIEMFFADGTICITWLDISAADGVAGLSKGTGLPPAFFVESDLTGYVPCWPYCDFNRDYSVDKLDLYILALHWLEQDCGIPSWCGKADLDRSAAVNSVDYAILAQNWLTTEDWWLQPISHWKFDESDGNTAYDSVGTNHGTLVNGPVWTTGQIDGALSFDGVDDYVKIPDSNSLDVTSQATLCAWIYTTSLTAGQGIVGRWNYSSSPSKESILLEARGDVDDRIRFNISTDGGIPTETVVASQQKFVANTWYHVAGTYDGVRMRLYINGQEDNSTPKSGNIFTSDSEWNIGAFNYGGVAYFEGTIDDVRIYDRALSAAEILQLYQKGLSRKAFNPNPADGATRVDPNTSLSWSAGKDALSHDVYFGTNFDDVNNATTGSPEYKGNQPLDANSFIPGSLDYSTTYYWRIDEINASGTVKGYIWSFTTIAAGIDPNLVSWWKFDEGSGTIAYDSAGDNDGQLVNGPAWTTGQIDGALSFDGTNDYVTVGSPANLDNLPLYNLTISAWIYDEHSTGETWGTIFGTYVSPNGWSFRTISNATGDRSLYLQVPFSGNNQSAWATYHSSYGTILGNTWHHVVGVWDSSTKTAKLYIDGAETTYQTANPGVGAYNSDASNNKEMGRLPLAVQYFNGIIDDVRIYNQALSAEEILQLYQKGLSSRALNPNPADREADVDPNIGLSWSAGKDALSHDVYFGTNFDDVNNATTSSPEFKGNQPLDANSFVPGPLEDLTTYYWRIDERNTSGTVKGYIWNFTTSLTTDPNFAAWWKFDEGIGTIAYDLIGNHNGSLINGPVWTTGQIDGALSFDGVNDYVSVPDSTAFTVTNFSIALWAKYIDNGYTQELLFHNYTVNKWFGLYGRSEDLCGGKIRFQLDDGTDIAICSQNSYDNNEWVHIAVVRDCPNAYIYINGELETSTTIGSCGTIDGGALEIGGWRGGGQSLNGLMDDVRFYDRALSAQEILQLYQQGLE